MTDKQTGGASGLPKGYWSFVWQRDKVRIVVGGLVLVVLFVWLGVPTPEAWWDWLEPVLTLTTLAIAAFVWIGQGRAAWEEYLPNRLTVSFKYEGEVKMRCEKAHLSAEADIRALAQQIGLQMAGESLLFVAPGVQVSGPEVDKVNRYLHYEVTIELRSLPESLAKDGVRVWKEPFQCKETNPWFPVATEGCRPN